MLRSILYTLLPLCFGHLSSGQNAPLPSRAVPFRELPYEFDADTAIVSGDLCLIRGDFGITKTYRYTGETWTEIPNPLPYGSWPVDNRDGLLAFTVTSEGNETRSIVEADSGEILWQDIPLPTWNEDFNRDHHVTMAPNDDFTSLIIVRDRDGMTYSHAVVTPPAVVDLKLGDDEIVYIQGIGLQKSLHRRSILTGEALSNWTLGGFDYRIAGFHEGKVLTTRAGNEMVLFIPGQPQPTVIPLPTAFLPDGAPINPGATEVLSYAKGGGWVRGPEGPALHYNMTASEGAICDLVAVDGEVVQADGPRLALFQGVGLPAVQVDAKIPFATLGEARGKEIGGVIHVPVLLDRPAPAETRLRVQGTGGGSAGMNDYDPVNAWVVIPEGQSRGTLTISLRPDTQAERHETIELSIAEAEGARFNSATRHYAVIEASGIGRSFVETPPAVPDWPAFTTQTVMGGDGLIYQVIRPDSKIPRVDVREPATGVVLESIPILGLRAGANSGAEPPFLQTTATGVRCVFREAPLTQAWDLGGIRSAAAVHVKINPPVEGGLPGHLEFRAAEAGPTAISVAWVWRAIPRVDGTPDTALVPAFPESDSISVPAEGAMAARSVMMRSAAISGRSLPLCLQVGEVGGKVTDLMLVEPTPGSFTPLGDPLNGDPAVIPARGPGGVKVIEGDLYVGNAKALDGSSEARGCVQVFDAATGAHIRTIFPPASLSHNGFGHMIEGDNDELFVVAAEEPAEGAKPKAAAKLRTLFVYSRATGELRAALRSGYARFGDLLSSSSEYLAVGAPSSSDGRKKIPGGIHVYRRSDYKLVARTTFSGNGLGNSIALTENALYVGHPGLARIAKVPGKRKKQRFEGAGIVHAYLQFPRLKRPEVIASPLGPKVDAGFGSEIRAEAGGDLLVREGDIIYLIDPTGSRPPLAEELPEDLFPLLSYQEENGLRFGPEGRLYDVGQRSPLVELSPGYNSAIGGGAVFLQDSEAPAGIKRVPFSSCGNFDLWLEGQGSAGDSGVSDNEEMEQYIMAQTGALPELKVHFPETDAVGRLRRMHLRSEGSLPPDATQLVEYSYLGGPWILVAVRRGNGPLASVEGGTERATGWWTPATESLFLPEEVQLRSTYFHSQAVALGKDEILTILDL